MASFIWLLVSFWNRNALPGDIDYVAEIENEPQQTPTSERPFHATVNDVQYLVEPEYAYDLTGMVVSYRRHEGNSRMHMQANDHINMIEDVQIAGPKTV